MEIDSKERDDDEMTPQLNLPDVWAVSDMQTLGTYNTDGVSFDNVFLETSRSFCLRCFPSLSLPPPPLFLKACHRFSFLMPRFWSLLFLSLTDPFYFCLLSVSVYANPFSSIQFSHQ